ncbi:MAG: AbgT family transporter [Bacteroidales bacterium]|nr:AbgT family transporter [Bacteroidales bacterium]
MKKKFPAPVVIVFVLIVLAAMLTWFLPGGQYVDGIFQKADSSPQTWQVFTAFYHGFVGQAGIIAFILCVGAAFWVINATRAIDSGIKSFLQQAARLERFPLLRRLGVNNLVIVSVMLLFSLFGAVFGMSEETIAFTALIIPLALSMGYDSITGVCMVYVAAHVGFAGAFMNPFTVGIAQDLSGLPIFSGMGYRLVCWAVLTTGTIAFVLRYAHKVKRDPKVSPMWEEDTCRKATLNAGVEMAAENPAEGVKTPWAARIAFFLVLAALTAFSVSSPSTMIVLGAWKLKVPGLLPVLTFLYAAGGLKIFTGKNKQETPARLVRHFVLFAVLFLLVGVLGYNWYISEIAGLFLALGILSGIAAGYGANTIAQQLTEGARDILGAALIVGLAAGIVEILEQGRIMDRILFAMAGGLESVGRAGSLQVMYLIQTAINMLIPSASAKAAMTMPIMAPFSDLVGVSRQATVLAFQFGDGFTNMITPISGVLMAVLGVARIPYTRWVRWVWRFILGLLVAGSLLLLPTLLIWS